MPTDILYINAHLAAHDNQQSSRIDQLNKILAYTNDKELGTVILSGDLNFRMVDGNDQATEFTNNYTMFKEHVINFPPTFKYHRGNPGECYNYKRTPSYCDRIFISSNHTVGFQKYDSLHNVLSSDHKPVYLQFSIIFNNLNELHQLIPVKSVSTHRKELVCNGYQFIWKFKILIVFIILLVCIYR